MMGKRRYEATHRSDDAAREKPPETERDRLLRQIERVTGERDAWRKRAENEGSLFDLKRDTAADIARTIAGNVGLHRLQSLSKALIEEIAAQGRAETGGLSNGNRTADETNPALAGSRHASCPASSPQASKPSRRRCANGSTVSAYWNIA
jgi:hypothetical protein